MAKQAKTLYFPDPREASPEGLVAVGRSFDPEILIEAYSRGIFPWPQEGLPLLWFSPDPRGVLNFSEMHIPRSLKKTGRQTTWTFSVNRAFAQVMLECQKQPRPGQSGTWILPDMIPAYCELQRQGLALSVECWDQDRLIGGIYGVLVQGLFSGESMFHLESNASKLSFLYLVKYLQGFGHTWMDIQMLTSVTEQLGGIYMPKEEFLKRRNSRNPHDNT